MCKMFIRSLLASAALAVVGAPGAHAAYVVTFQQDGADVVATGSGSLDVTELDAFGEGPANGSQIDPSVGVEIITPDAVSEAFKGISGPTSFGPGGFFSTGVQTAADVVGIEATLKELIVPNPYVSGGPLSGTATFANQTFASLGLTPGTYVWSWGAGDHKDTYTIDIDSRIGSVPEPSTWALMFLGFAGLCGAGWRAQRRSAALAA